MQVSALATKITKKVTHVNTIATYILYFAAVVSPNTSHGYTSRAGIYVVYWQDVVMHWES